MSNNFERFLILIGIIISTAAISHAQQVFVAHLSGAQEVPAVSTSGKGVCKIILNAPQNQITVNCQYSGLSRDANVAYNDYDGDGKTDLGAIRNENGSLVWYVLQSSNGQQRNFYWGTLGDR